MTEESKFESVEDLLDGTLDDIDDLPEFKPFPAGSHMVKASLEIKEVNGKQCVELSMTAMETLELSNPATDELLKEGDQTSVLFMLDNEFGQGKMKKILAPLGEVLGTRATREIIEQTTDMEVAVLTKIRKNKNDPDQVYTDVVELSVAE
jgi:hypothetical protein